MARTAYGIEYEAVHHRNRLVWHRGEIAGIKRRIRRRERRQAEREQRETHAFLRAMQHWPED